MSTLILLNFIITVFLSLVTYLMVRQIAILVAQVSPRGFRHDEDGPRIGENVDSEVIASHNKTLHLIVFGSQACAVCNFIKDQGLDQIAESWRMTAQVSYIADEAANSLPIIPRNFYQITDGKPIRHHLGVSFVPFALVLDKSNRVLVKGLVNHPSHVENLLEMAEGKIKDTIYSRYSA